MVITTHGAELVGIMCVQASIGYDNIAHQPSVSVYGLQISDFEVGDTSPCLINIGPLL